MAGVDELLASPGVDRLVADVEVRRHLGDTVADATRSRTLRRNSGEYRLGIVGCPPDY